MKSSTILQLFVIVMLAFSFIVSPASAQYEPQPGAADEDGDILISNVPAFEEGSSAYTGELESRAERQVSAAAPLPLYPDGVSVRTKTPTFKFTKLVGATKYEIYVYDGTTSSLLYSFKGSPNCSSGECRLTPGFKLKNLGLNPGGYYKWVVRAKTTGGWQSESPQAEFWVHSKGFTSNFDTSKKWLSINGDWSIVSPGYLKTQGVTGQVASIVQTEYFTDYFIYEVKMKRKFEFDDTNRVYFSGNPNDAGPLGWKDGYMFSYTNDGYIFFYKVVDSALVALKPGTYYPGVVNAYGWNTLTIWRDTPWIDLWLNGHYIGYVTDTTFTNMYTGIGMYRYSAEKSPLLVDWATLKYSTTPPWTIPLSMAGERDPAYELVPTETTGDVDVNRSLGSDQ